MANKTAPKVLEQRKKAAERAARAMQLRIGGATYQQIADQLGYASKGAAYNACRIALESIPREPAEELRQIELERYDAIQLRLMGRLSQGDLSVVPNLLRLSDQRARLLGINKPEQVTLTAEVAIHDDPATLRLREALLAAERRREQSLLELNAEAREAGLLS